MFKRGLLTVTLLTFSPVQAACLGGAEAIGDIGPASELVCEVMNSLYPDECEMVDFLPLQRP